MKAFFRGLIEHKIEETAQEILQEVLITKLKNEEIVLQQTMMACPTCNGKGRGKEFEEFWRYQSEQLANRFVVSTGGFIPPSYAAFGNQTCYTCLGKGHIEK